MQTIGYPAVQWTCPHCDERQTDEGRGGELECLGCGQMINVVHVDSVCVTCRHRRAEPHNSLCKLCRQEVDHQERMRV